MRIGWLPVSLPSTSRRSAFGSLRQHEISPSICNVNTRGERLRSLSFNCNQMIGLIFSMMGAAQPHSRWSARALSRPPASASVHLSVLPADGLTAHFLYGQKPCSLKNYRAFENARALTPDPCAIVVSQRPSGHSSTFSTGNKLSSYRVSQTLPRCLWFHSGLWDEPDGVRHLIRPPHRP